MELENGAILKSKSVIVSTGARWRNVGVPGEAEFKNKGVAYAHTVTVHYSLEKT